MKCYVCRIEDDIFEEHHLIPQSRGGENKPTIYLCIKHHKQSHLLAISTSIAVKDIVTDLEPEQNERLKKVVTIIRIADKKLDHADFYNVQIKMPGVLHSIIKNQAKIHKTSIPKVINSILTNYFLKREKGV